MAVLTFVSDSLLGKWSLLPQQQTEKQADTQAHRGNPGIRAYNRRAPSVQSFYLLEGGATRVGWTERAGGMVTWVGVTPPPPPPPTTSRKKGRSLPQFYIYSGKCTTWLSTEEDGDEEKCFHHWMESGGLLTHVESSAVSRFTLNNRSALIGHQALKVVFELHLHLHWC